MFQRMLPSVNLVYLGCSVLSIIDQSYISRFWTQFEAWLGFQVPTESGLRPAQPERRRIEIAVIHGATESLREHLQSTWANKTVDDARHFLAAPDVAVTNESDKTEQLTKLVEIDELARDAWRSHLPVDVPPVPSSAAPPVEERQSRRTQSALENLFHMEPVGGTVSC